MMTTDPLLIQMTSQADAWEKSGDHRFVFLRCYSMMTGNMLKGIADGRFNDAGWVAHLLHRFAGYYLIALRIYDTHTDQAPVVWKQVHDASRGQELHVLQHLLLGINAHINYDLVMAIYDAMAPDWETLSEEKRRVRMADHHLVNEIIGETIDAVQDTVIERHAPVMSIVDNMLGRVDEWLLSELITSWRADVWNESCALLSAESDQEREMHRLSLEQKVMNTASRLLVF